MDLIQLRSYKLVAAKITVHEVAWKKFGEGFKGRYMISRADVELTFRSTVTANDALTLKDTMLPAGCGAFKDVYVLDKHSLVVKLMMKELNKQTWNDEGAEEEQRRFDEFSASMLERMAFCYAQVYLASSASEPWSSGNVLSSGEERRLGSGAAAASILCKKSSWRSGMKKCSFWLASSLSASDFWIRC